MERRRIQLLDDINNNESDVVMDESVEGAAGEFGAEDNIEGLYVQLPDILKPLIIYDINGTQTIDELKTMMIDLASSKQWHMKNVLDDKRSIESYNIFSGQYVRIVRRGM
jgi:hypothetical protein